MPDAALPPHLRGKKHTDWPWPFRWIPRGWTAFQWGQPRLLAGSAECATKPAGEDHEWWGGNCRPKPINPERSWQVSWFPHAPWWAWPALYVSISGRRAADGKFRNYRAGPRWDNADYYVNWAPFLPSSRRYDGTDQQDTSTGPDKKP